MPRMPCAFICINFVHRKYGIVGLFPKFSYKIRHYLKEFFRAKTSLTVVYCHFIRTGMKFTIWKYTKIVFCKSVVRFFWWCMMLFCPFNLGYGTKYWFTKYFIKCIYYRYYNGGIMLNNMSTGRWNGSYVPKGFVYITRYPIPSQAIRAGPCVESRTSERHAQVSWIDERHNFFDLDWHRSAIDCMSDKRESTNNVRFCASCCRSYEQTRLDLVWLGPISQKFSCWLKR